MIVLYGMRTIAPSVGVPGDYTDRRASVLLWYLTLHFAGGKRPLTATYDCERLRPRRTNGTQPASRIKEKPEIAAPAVRSQVRRKFTSTRCCPAGTLTSIRAIPGCEPGATVTPSICTVHAG